MQAGEYLNGGERGRHHQMFYHKQNRCNTEFAAGTVFYRNGYTKYIVMYMREWEIHSMLFKF